MRELLVVAVVAAMLVVVALGMFVFGDGAMLVAPPESVAEGFVRQLASHRPRQARLALSEHLRGGCSERRLTAWMWDIEGTLGTIEQVEGKDPAIARDEAWATVVVRGEKRNVEVRLHLAREHGLWRVARLPDFDEF